MIEPRDDPIFEENWGIEEELIFFTAIQSCGFGNWADIANFVETRSAEECEAHYENVFLNSETAPKPQFTVKPPAKIPPKPAFSTDAVESNPADSHPENMRFNGMVPAEVCGYMPRRGQFDEEFNDDAEHLIDGITFDENDSQKDFELKLSSLMAFNDQLLERKLRTNVVIEWNLQYEPNINLGCNTPVEKEIQKDVLTFAPYFGKDETISILNSVRDYNRQCERLRRLMFWQKNGVRNKFEGFLFQKLGSLIHENKISNSNVEEWNKYVKEYQRYCDENDFPDQQILSKEESELCKKNDIPIQLYYALKDLIIRECAIRQSLTKEQAINIDPDHNQEISLIYDLFYNLGWIV